MVAWSALQPSNTPDYVSRYIVYKPQILSLSSLPLLLLLYYYVRRERILIPSSSIVQLETFHVLFHSVNKTTPTPPAVENHQLPQ